MMERCPRCDAVYQYEPSYIVWEFWDGVPLACDCGYRRPTEDQP